MKIIIRTLPRNSHALGGEDQICFFLQKAFETAGHNVQVVFDKYRGEAPDLYVSLGIGDKPPSGKSFLWYFNESIDCELVSSLGYDVVATNMVDISDTGFRHLPLAADMSMAPLVDSVTDNDLIAYVGNLSKYKLTAIEKWLVPLSQVYPDRLVIFGGSNWPDHPVLRDNYKGILHPDSWPWLRGIARTWVCFRADGQSDMGMMPDRIYNLLATGVGRIVSDCPVENDLKSMIVTADTPDEFIEACRPTDLTDSFSEGPDYIRTSATYTHRAHQILAWAGA